MKKVFSLILAFTIAITGVSATGAGNIKAEAATSFDSPATNISLSTAEEIDNNSFKEGSFAKTDSYLQRWYKFTNNSSSAAVAEVTLSKTGGDVWPNYSFYDAKGKAETGLCYSGSFTQNGDTVNVGLEAGETKYLKISKDSAWSLSWRVSVSIRDEEANTFKKTKAVKSGKMIYGNADFVGDEDVFKIKAKKSGTMVITVNNNDCGGLFGKFKYTVYNKSKVAKKSGTLDATKSGKYKIKVKKGQVVYVKVAVGGDMANYLGSYSVKTKIK